MFANSVAPVAWNGNQFALRKENNSRLNKLQKTYNGDYFQFSGTYE